MTLIPIATFLAGALLSLLIPVVLLIALVAWYMIFLRRAPDSAQEPIVPEAVPPASPEHSGSSPV